MLQELIVMLTVPLQPAEHNASCNLKFHAGRKRYSFHRESVDQTQGEN